MKRCWMWVFSVSLTENFFYLVDVLMHISLTCDQGFLPMGAGYTSRCPVGSSLTCYAFLTSFTGLLGILWTLCFPGVLGKTQPGKPLVYFIFFLIFSEGRHKYNTSSKHKQFKRFSTYISLTGMCNEFGGQSSVSRSRQEWKVRQRASTWQLALMYIQARGNRY